MKLVNTKHTLTVAAHYSPRIDKKLSFSKKAKSESQFYFVDTFVVSTNHGALASQ